MMYLKNLNSHTTLVEFRMTLRHSNILSIDLFLGPICKAFRDAKKVYLDIRFKTLVTIGGCPRMKTKKSSERNIFCMLPDYFSFWNHL